MTSFRYVRPEWKVPPRFPASVVVYGHRFMPGKVVKLTEDKLEDAPNMEFAVAKLRNIKIGGGRFEQVTVKKVRRKKSGNNAG